MSAKIKQTSAIHENNPKILKINSDSVHHNVYIDV